MIAVQIQCVLQILPLSCEFVIKEKSSHVFNFGDQPASWILSTGENPLIYVQTFVHTFWCISYENEMKSLFHNVIWSLHIILKPGV